MSIGNIKQTQDKYNEAIKIYNNIIDIEPNNSEAYMNIGNSYNELGELNKAVEFYKIAKEKNDSLPKINFNLGLAFYKLRDYESAMVCFEKLDHNLSREKLLQCQYKLKKINEFNINLEKICEGKNTSRLVASLSSHAEVNFKQKI